MRVKIIEREKQIELEEKEIARREKQYDAEVKKKQMQIAMLLSNQRKQKSKTNEKGRCGSI